VGDLSNVGTTTVESSAIRALVQVAEKLSSTIWPAPAEPLFCRRLFLVALVHPLVIVHVLDPLLVAIQSSLISAILTTKIVQNVPT
jgi:hypothetical protein